MDPSYFFLISKNKLSVIHFGHDDILLRTTCFIKKKCKIFFGGGGIRKYFLSYFTFKYTVEDILSIAEDLPDESFLLLLHFRKKGTPYFLLGMTIYFPIYYQGHVFKFQQWTRIYLKNCSYFCFI